MPGEAEPAPSRRLTLTVEVAVCIPHQSRSLWHDSLFELVSARWREHFPSWPLVVSTSQVGPFSRAWARNDLWRQAPGDVLVFCDADTTFLDPADVVAAAEVASAGGWTLPARYHECGRPWTRSALTGTVTEPRGSQVLRTIDNSPGGIMAVPRAALDLVGGWDEAFSGWGWEDTAMRASLDALWGQHHRIGTVCHLWHERPRRAFLGQPSARHNKARFRRYAEAWQRGTMRELYAELGRNVGPDLR